jgi:hypothetical protein
VFAGGSTRWLAPARFQTGWSLYSVGREMEPTRAEALERSMESVAAAFICVHEQNQAPSVEEGVLAGAVSRLSASIHKPCVQAQTVRQQDDASGTVRADQHVTSAQPACPQSATRNKVRAAHEAQDAPASDAEAGAHDMLQSPSTQDVFAVEALRGLRSGVSGAMHCAALLSVQDALPRCLLMLRLACEQVRSARLSIPRLRTALHPSS